MGQEEEQDRRQMEDCQIGSAEEQKMKEEAK